MTDPISTSKSARESLARGLHALQADPSVPPHLAELAAPIAQAMGALHQLERTGQVAPHAEVAMTHVRGALSQLQAQSSNHAAVNQALEAVAASLSLVHSLTRMAIGIASTQLQPPTAQALQQAPVPQAQQAVQTHAMAQKQMPPAAYQPSPQHAHGGPRVSAGTGQGGAPPQPQAFPQPRMSNPQPSFQQSPPAGTGPMVSRDPFAAPVPTGAAPAPQPSPHRQSAPQPAPNMPMGGAPPHGSPSLVNADLGAHSPTNFYKGLAGNDIIDHGGLFVSTYVLPKLNTPVRLKVSLPGGYEFEANAVVRWTREDGGDDAPPGFGAQFTQITPEARQLVYRYVRNREPIFHDDL